MLHDYTLLQSRHPDLVRQLVEVEKRARLDIPTTQMYQTKVSGHLSGSNLYVVGFGSAARIIVWDTALARLSTPQLLFLCCHELGHYALHHVLKMFFLTLALFLGVFYLGYHVAKSLVQRRGQEWGFTRLDDWASLPLLWLVFSVILFLCFPLLNTYHRRQEHQADKYGLHLIHGLISEPNQAAAQSLEVLGKDWLEYPYMNQFFVVWLWDHPPISDRIRFVLAYD